MSNFEQEAYYEKVNAQFADLMYKQMVSKRYGLEVCGLQVTDRPEKFLVKKDLQDLNGIMDPLCNNEGNPNPEIPTGETLLASAPEELAEGEVVTSFPLLPGDGVHIGVTVSGNIADLAGGIKRGKGY